MLRNRLLIRVACACLALPGIAHAAGNDAPAGPPPAENGKPRVPPNEAFTACEGKKEGDAVTFTTPRGEKLTGKCKMMPAKLAAVPDHPPRPPEGSKPPQ